MVSSDVTLCGKSDVKTKIINYTNRVGKDWKIKLSDSPAALKAKSNSSC